ncbi:hypothetical protein VNO77_00128 [Canavalia gladiata]|uniref:Uncharacterized protein n=1 Tax=Canavalia gladiata TaxID=3824 RepID=A0AAN9R8Z4_CANGL
MSTCWQFPLWAALGNSTIGWWNSTRESGVWEINVISQLLAARGVFTRAPNQGLPTKCFNSNRIMDHALILSIRLKLKHTQRNYSIAQLLISSQSKHQFKTVRVRDKTQHPHNHIQITNTNKLNHYIIVSKI